MGLPIKRHLSREKTPPKQERAFSGKYDAAARMGRQSARRSSRHLIDSFDSLS
jgi:hypothetical protein